MSTLPPNPPPPAAPPQYQPQISPQAPIEPMALVGFILSFIFWPVGLILSIIGLTKIPTTHNRGKGLAIAGIIISGLGALLFLLVVSTAGANSGRAPLTSQPAVEAPASSSSPSPAAEPTQAAPVSMVGQTVVSDGIEFTLSAVTCGIAQVGSEYLNKAAQGQYCQVDVTIKNSSNDPFLFNSSGATGYIGEARYDADGEAGIYADSSAFLEEINPGNSVSAALFFDIPVGAALTKLQFNTGFIGAAEFTL